MTRYITAHKGGRTARAPEARIRPDTLACITETMHKRGMSWADLIEEQWGVVSIEKKPKGERKMSKNLYRAWAQNQQGASGDVANRENFSSVKAAENAARHEFGSGWKIKINKLNTDENGYILSEEQVKEFSIR